jgi:hypothetical protein
MLSARPVPDGSAPPHSVWYNDDEIFNINQPGNPRSKWRRRPIRNSGFDDPPCPPHNDAESICSEPIAPAPSNVGSAGDEIIPYDYGRLDFDDHFHRAQKLSELESDNGTHIEKQTALEPHTDAEDDAPALSPRNSTELAKPRGRADSSSTGSVVSTCTFVTAATFLSRNSKGSVIQTKRPCLTVDNLHTSRARDAGLITNEDDELDWSGFGMHVQFPDDATIPLRSQREIARTHRAVVEAVRCRRISLARKTMLCHRKFTPQEALEEVKHLNKLKHSHIVRLVGSYFQRRSLSILTYPVAECDLEMYMRHDLSSFARMLMYRAFGCLLSALAHIHNMGIKHMDIKVSPTKHKRFPYSLSRYRGVPFNMAMRK